jgi:hypothetical protein
VRRRRYDDEAITGGTMYVETYEDDDGNGGKEWTIDFTADVTPVRAATHWDPAEGGEVENLEWDEAVCTQTKERMTWVAWVDRYLVSEAQVEAMERAAEDAISNGTGRACFVCDEPRDVAVAS